MDTATQRRLEEAFFQTILDFPERIDAMEVRDDEACRNLARELVKIVESAVERGPA